MKKLGILLLSTALAFFIGACERQEETPVTGQPAVEREQPPATTGQQPGPPAEREPAGTTGQTTGVTGQPAAPAGQPPEEQTTAMQPGEQAAGQAGKTGQEFLGQSPEFGNAPETIVLQAKNGNVTLPHKQHAELMDCKTCHGDTPPGPIEGFSKDQAHALCQGCHKEKGAGPTKCQECHKKS